MKKIAIALLLFVLGAGGAYTALVLKRRQGAKTSAEACGKHSLKAQLKNAAQHVLSQFG